jgi:ornithine carbamoyltransferase
MIYLNDKTVKSLNLSWDNNIQVNWREVFAPFKVSQELLYKYPNSIFMHDLPAHRGEEVDPEVLDGSKSIAFKQAGNKLNSACAILEWCLIPDNF